jgi:hypothetical protein
MTDLFFGFFTFLILAAAVWTVAVITIGEIDERRRRDVAQLRRELDDLRTQLLTHIHRP